MQTAQRIHLPRFDVDEHHTEHRVQGIDQGKLIARRAKAVTWRHGRREHEEGPDSGPSSASGMREIYAAPLNTGR